MTVEEIKDLILWCKAQKIDSLKIGDIEFKLSPLGLLDEEAPAPAPGGGAGEGAETGEPEDSPASPPTGAVKEDERLLYQSAD